MVNSRWFETLGAVQWMMCLCLEPQWPATSSTRLWTAAGVRWSMAPLIEMCGQQPSQESKRRRSRERSGRCPAKEVAMQTVADTVADYKKPSHQINESSCKKSQRMWQVCQRHLRPVQGQLQIRPISYVWSILKLRRSDPSTVAATGDQRVCAAGRGRRRASWHWFHTFAARFAWLQVESRNLRNSGHTGHSGHTTARWNLDTWLDTWDLRLDTHHNWQWDPHKLIERMSGPWTTPMKQMMTTNMRTGITRQT